MPRMQVGAVELEVEVMGEARDPTLVLVMGLGAQLIHWPTAFCERLVERGLRVVRFDNRDAGRSTILREAGAPAIAPLVARWLLGRPGTVPYRLDDMADDVVGLLDGLGLERAHVCGASMGGMIAQLVALRRPDRVASLVSMMSTTGERHLPRISALTALLAGGPRTKEASVQRSMNLFRAIGGTLPFDEEGCRALAELSWERGRDPAGFMRQLAAVLAAPSRAQALRALEGLPTLVLHGTADPLVPVAAGHETARAIPGARLELVPGMGHHLPSAAWPQLIDAISSHVHTADRARVSSVA